jgi:hypothetical protein
MTPSHDAFPPAREGQRLHRRLEEADPVATAEVCRAYRRPLLYGWLRTRFVAQKDRPVSGEHHAAHDPWHRRVAQGLAAGPGVGDWSLRPAGLPPVDGHRPGPVQAGDGGLGVTRWSPAFRRQRPAKAGTPAPPPTRDGPRARNRGRNPNGSATWAGVGWRHRPQASHPESQSDIPRGKAPPRPPPAHRPDADRMSKRASGLRPKCRRRRANGRDSLFHLGKCLGRVPAWSAPQKVVQLLRGSEGRVGQVDSR